MPVHEVATSAAMAVLQHLEPHCERIQVGGSIRRKVKNAKDIEIICIPKMVKISHQLNLFEEPVLHWIRDPAFCTAVNSFAFKKGGCAGKAMQRLDESGYVIDIFTANKINWGYIFLLRTGSREFNINLLERLKGRGFVCKDGYIYKGIAIVHIPEEIDISNSQK